MSSEGDANDALANLRRELRALQHPGSDPVDDEPPVAELEALALSLTKLKTAGAVPFDRKRTWDAIEERIESPDPGGSGAAVDPGEED